MKRLHLVLGNLIAFFGLFLLVSPTFAGGPLVSLSADPKGWVSDAGYGTVIRFYLNTSNFPCKDSQVTFKFTDSQDGDYIMTGSGTSTYTIQEDGLKGCSTYAKMASKKSGTRMVTAVVKNGDKTLVDPYVPTIKVDFDGQYHSDSSYNGYNYRSSVEDPYGTYGAVANPTTTPTPTPLPTLEGTLNVWLLSQEALASNERFTYVKWTALNTTSSYGVFYDVYLRKSGDKEWQKMLPGEGGPSAGIALKSDQDYYVKVQGCIKKVGNCVTSNELYIAKSSSTSTNITKATKQETTLVSSASSEESQKVAELNKKVASLENQLSTSQKKQGVLEQRINDLVNFIKKIFPFFK